MIIELTAALGIEPESDDYERRINEIESTVADFINNFGIYPEYKFATANHDKVLLACFDTMTLINTLICEIKLHEAEESICTAKQEISSMLKRAAYAVDQISIKQKTQTYQVKIYSDGEACWNQIDLIGDSVSLINQIRQYRSNGDMISEVCINAKSGKDAIEKARALLTGVVSNK